MNMENNDGQGMDAEQAQAQNEGGQAGWWELGMALAWFIATGLWSLFVGGWIRLGRRIVHSMRRRKTLAETSNIEHRMKREITNLRFEI